MKINIIAAFICTIIMSLKDFDIEAQTIDYQKLYECDLKYWNYRYRFLGDDIDRTRYPGFIIVNSSHAAEAGYSLPAKYRNRPKSTWDWIYNPAYDLCYDVSIWGNGATGQLDYSDNPLVTLGNYLSVLSTEWLLLSLNCQSTDATTEELYGALVAIERLDDKGETIYNNLAPAQNGFLARSDIDQNFVATHFGDNFKFAAGPSVCTAGPYNGIQDVNGCDNQSSLPIVDFTRNAMSQDEVIGLLQGLRFVARCLPAMNPVYYQTYNLREHAITITDHILSRLSNADYIIKDPYDENRVCRGGDAQAFAYPFSVIGNDITGGNYSAASFAISLPAWFLLENFFDIYSGSNKTMELKLAAMSGTFGSSYLAIWSYQYDKDIYDLMGAFLNGYTSYAQSSDYWLNFLAPFPCSGPCYDCNCITPNGLDYTTVGCGSHYPFIDQDIWEPQIHDVINDEHNYGEFNGLDYMLAYNLFLLNYFDFSCSNGAYYNKIERYDDKVYPFSTYYSSGDNVVWGSNDNPVIYEAAKKWTLAVDVTSPDANVSFFAGNEIVHDPGYNVVATGTNTEVEGFADIDCNINSHEQNIYTYFSYKNSTSQNNSFQQNNYNDKNNASIMLNIYPNPANSFTNIQLNKDGVFYIKIVDIYGKLFLAKPINRSTELDLSDIAKGLYNVEILDEEKEIVVSGKLIKQ